MHGELWSAEHRWASPAVPDMHWATASAQQRLRALPGRSAIPLAWKMPGMSCACPRSAASLPYPSAEALGVPTLGQCQAAVTRTAVLEQGDNSLLCHWSPVAASL